MTKSKKETMYSTEGHSDANLKNAGEKTFTVLSHGVEMRLTITDEQMLVVNINDKGSPFTLIVPFNIIGTVALADENLVVLMRAA